MNSRILQFAAVLLLGVSLGVGIASYRSFMPDQFAAARPLITRTVRS